MRKILLLISFLITIALSAQTYYYQSTGAYDLYDGSTYKDVVSPSKMVSLYNVIHKWVEVEHAYKDGRPLDKEFYDAKRTVYVQGDTWTKQKCYSIVNNAFTVEEKKRLKGFEIGIALYINSETGRIDDVEFNFISLHPFATIYPSVYRDIEKELKQNVWFIPTAKGKQLNYIFHYWLHEVK